MKTFAATAIAALMAAASASESGLRDLQTLDCSDILEMKIYEPGKCAKAPVYTPGEPGFIIKRLLENKTNCVAAAKLDSYNIMMYTTNPKPACGTTLPACGRLKLYCTSEGKTVLRRLERTWPYFLYGDTPCNPDGTIDSDCNPAAFINSSPEPLPVGDYYIQGETFANCPATGQPTGLLDSLTVNFTVKDKC